MSSAGGLLPLAARQELLMHDVKVLVSEKKSWTTKRTNWLVEKKTLTCFLSADGEFFAGKATANLVVWVHADAVNAGRVQLYNVGLVVGGWDVPGCVHVIPGVCQILDLDTFRFLRQTFKKKVGQNLKICDAYPTCFCTRCHSWWWCCFHQTSGSSEGSCSCPSPPSLPVQGDRVVLCVCVREREEMRALQLRSFPLGCLHTNM